MILTRIQSRIVAVIIAVVFFTLTSAYFVIQFSIRNALQQNIETNAHDLLNSTLSTIDTQYKMTLAYRESVIRQKKSELQFHMDIALSFLNDVYSRYSSGMLSEDDAKIEAIRIIKQLRYDNNIGYFWINNTGQPYPKMIMNPVIPDFDGTVLDKPEFNVVKGDDQNLFSAFVDICLEKGNGFVEYLWPKSISGGKKLSEIQPKISFVRLFKPWNWIIGTGVYMDDIEREVKNQLDSVIQSLNQTIAKYKLGETGYFFVFNENNRILIHPGLAGIDGSSYLDPITGKIIFNEFKEAYLNGDSSFEYLWDKPGDEGNYIYKKKVFLSYFEPLGWYIGGSVYQDDFEQIISRISTIILVIFLFFIGFAVIISVFISKSIVSPLNRLIAEIENQDKGGMPGGTFSQRGPEEIRLLSITLNRMVEANIKSSAHYKNLFDNALVGIFRLDTENGVFIEVNDKIAELIGLPKHEIIGKLSTRDLYKDPEVRNRILEKLMHNGEVTGYEFEMIMPDGREFVFSNSIKLYSEEKYIEGIVIDITRARRVEEEKALLQDQLAHQRKMEVVGQLAGGIAHDFNNMLSGIMGAAQLLESPKRNLDEKGRKLVSMILDASRQAADLTAKLLAFGRRGKNISVAVDIHDVIQSSILILEKTINKNIILSASLSAGERIVNGDKTELMNAIMNLGINASHAMPGGGKLLISTANINLEKEDCLKSSFAIEPGLYVKISIKDTGSGIKKENLDRIFEPFFTTKESGKGTGLGLSAVYGVVLDHNGSIDVSSQENVGTRFEMYFPCSKSNVQQGRAGDKNIKGSGTVLLVDDEKLLRFTGKSLIEELGYKVILAENGLQAVDIFRTEYQRIDIVVMDMIMPVLNGAKAFRRMRELDPLCKVIITSGFTYSENIGELMDEGLKGFIPKPFNKSDLSQLLASVLTSEI